MDNKELIKLFNKHVSAIGLRRQETMYGIGKGIMSQNVFIFRNLCLAIYITFVMVM